MLTPAGQAPHRSVWVCAALALLVFLALGACAPEHRERASAAGAIAIGELQSLSGPLATRGAAFHRGFASAIEARNASGGVRGRAIEVQTLDDRSRAGDAELGAARLVRERRVVLVFGGSSSELLQAFAGSCGDVPIVSPFGSGLSALEPRAGGAWVAGLNASETPSADDEALGRACGELVCTAIERTRTFEPVDLWRAIGSVRSVRVGNDDRAAVREDQARAFDAWWLARERARAAQSASK